MIGKKTNEIAGFARSPVGPRGKIFKKAHKTSSFQFSVSSVQPGKGRQFATARMEEGEIPKSKDQAPEKLQSAMINKHLFPALVASTASRGEEGDYAAVGLTRIEDGSAPEYSKAVATVAQTLWRAAGDSRIPKPGGSPCRVWYFARILLRRAFGQASTITTTNKPLK